MFSVKVRKQLILLASGLFAGKFAHNNKNDVRNLANALVDMKLVDEGNEPCDVCNTKKPSVYRYSVK